MVWLIKSKRCVPTNPEEIEINEFSYSYQNKPFIELRHHNTDLQNSQTLDMTNYGLILLHVNIDKRRQYPKKDNLKFIVTGMLIRLFI